MQPLLFVKQKKNNQKKHCRAKLYVSVGVPDIKAHMEWSVKSGIWPELGYW